MKYGQTLCMNLDLDPLMLIFGTEYSGSAVFKLVQDAMESEQAAKGENALSKTG